MPRLATCLLAVVLLPRLAPNRNSGVDFFPERPRVISLDIDWGTFGRTGLFRGRATAGVVVWGMETYLGYEYLDIGRTQCNNLVAGVRVWR